MPPTSRLTALGMPSLELGLFSVFVGGGGGWGHAAARNRERLPILGMTRTVAHKPLHTHTTELTKRCLAVVCKRLPAQTIDHGSMLRMAVQ